jgi:hypothetical protein
MRRAAMINFDGCDDCVDVLVNFTNGEPMTDQQAGWTIPNMTDLWPELKGHFTSVRIANEGHFSHTACQGCGSPVSGNRRAVRVYI